LAWRRRGGGGGKVKRRGGFVAGSKSLRARDDLLQQQVHRNSLKRPGSGMPGGEEKVLERTESSSIERKSGKGRKAGRGLWTRPIMHKKRGTLNIFNEGWKTKIKGNKDPTKEGNMK